jgi:uncharacterized protein YydD (DUF2326 family)
MKHRNRVLRYALNLQLFAETDLKTLLGEELFNQVTAKLGDKHKVAVVSDGNWIPKSKFDEVNTAKKTAEDTLKERDKQLDDLKKSAGDNATLKEQIQKLQDDNKTAKDKYDADMKELRTSTALKLALTGQVHDPDIVASLLDKTKIELDDNGTVKAGLEDQVKALRDSKAFLFVEQKPGGPQFRGAKPPEGSGGAGGGGQMTLSDAIAAHYSGS